MGCHHNQTDGGVQPPASAAADSASNKPKSDKELLASCQPEPRSSLASVPQFVVGNRYDPARARLAVRFSVNKYGFALDPYLASATGGVSRQDVEAAFDFVRHLTFTPPAAEECQTVKMQMVGIFRMSKDGDQWITIFDSHPVYSFDSQNKVVVNQN